MLTGTGIANLPIPGSKSAPKKFKGKYSDVRPFLRHYEQICTRLSITDDKEKIQNITQYCSRQVRVFLESLTSYDQVPLNWEAFKNDIIKFFDAERDDQVYKKSDLQAYTRESRKKSVAKNLSTWRTYTRGFQTISGWLRKKEYLTENDEAVEFWKGIPKDFRRVLEPWLLATDPDHDMTKPFSIKEVSKKAETLLQRNRFDRDRTQYKEESEDESDTDDSDSDSDSEDEKPHKHRKHKSSKKRSSRKVEESSDSESEDSDDEDFKVTKIKKRKTTKQKHIIESDAEDDQKTEAKQVQAAQK